MGTSLKLLYWTIEINLILWLMVLAALYRPAERESVTAVALAGFVLAAVLQHWAYYGLRKASQAGGQ